MPQIRMKHMGSTAADLDIEYSVDDSAKVVEMKTAAFNSALVEDFLLTVLLPRYGVNAIRDDREDFNPPRAPWRVFLTMAERRFEVEMHLLPEIGGVKAATTVLRPIKSAGTSAGKS